MAEGFGSFIFGGNTGLSYDELQRRRKVLQERQAAQRPYPTTIGQGLTALGEAVGNRMAENRLMEADRAEQAKVDEAYSRLRGASGATPTSAPAAAPAARPPVTNVNVTPNTAGVPSSLLNPTPGVFGGAPPTPAPSVSPRADAVRTQLTHDLLDRGDLSGGPVQATAFARPEVAQENPTVASLGSPSGDQWLARQNAIARIESGGNYQAVGPATRGDRPYGKYQVMGTNVGPWTEAALGRRMTPAEFLASPEAQDATFRHRFGQYVDKYGEEGAAQAWIGGPGSVGKTGRKDVLGTSVGSYGQQYVRGLRGASAEAAPEAGPDAPISGSAPIRFAALNTGTVSDAPPIMPRIPGTTTAEPTPTDIETRPATFDERWRALGSTAAAAPETTTRVAGPATATGEYVMPEPKPPAVPDRIPETPLEMAARDLLARQGGNPAMKRIAEQTIEEEKAKREYAQARLVTRYNADVQAYERDMGAYRNWERDRQKLREEALQRAANLAKTRQETETGKIITSEGRVMKYDPATGTMKDITPAYPGTEAGGPPQIKLTAEQGKELSNHTKAATAIEQYNRITDADKVLAEGLKDELAGRLPFFGNAALSKRYRIVRNQMENFLQAHLRSTSGAAITDPELRAHWAALVPTYGDDARTLEQKRLQRQQITEGMYLGLGTARPLADYATRKRGEEDAAEQRKRRDEMKEIKDPKVGKIYTDEKGNRRYWTGSRWEVD